MSSGACIPMLTMTFFSLFLGDLTVLGRPFSPYSFFCSSRAMTKNFDKNSAPSTNPSPSLSNIIIKAPTSGYANLDANDLWRHFLNSSAVIGGPLWKASKPMLLAAVLSNLKASSLIFLTALILSASVNLVFSLSFSILSLSFLSASILILSSALLCLCLLDSALLSLSWCFILKNWFKNSAPSTSPSPSLSKIEMTAPSSPGESFSSKVLLSISLKT
mmetsp:Transcript_22575/g.46904  ORF Transcript_22575/g.46904 Transcript_22575/m.46904 type:complete len:218 (-) Transcript_22575:1988-2641(-)